MQILLLVTKPHLTAPKIPSFLLCLQGTLEPASLQLLRSAEQASTHLLVSPISTSEIIIQLLNVLCLNCEAWSESALPVTFHKPSLPSLLHPIHVLGSLWCACSALVNPAGIETAAPAPSTSAMPDSLLGLWLVSFCSRTLTEEVAFKWLKTGIDNKVVFLCGFNLSFFWACF